MTAAEVDGLMPFYEKGAATGGFEAGVRTALEAVLASPHFVFRMERDRPAAATGQHGTASPISTSPRGSRSSSGARRPTRSSSTLATTGRLTAPGMLEKQARRMLADPRAEALGERFAAQWLRLQDLDKVHPDPNFFPNFDENVGGGDEARDRDVLQRSGAARPAAS